MKYKDFFLLERSDSSYSYGCVMLFGDSPQIFKIQDAIDPKDIYTEDGPNKFGLEDEFHITLLYGLHDDVSVKDVEKKLNSLKFPKRITLKNMSCFYQDEYDVLIFEADSNVLYDANESLKELPFTSEYPNYKPHLTIGYVKSGCGKKYLKKFKNIVSTETFRPTNAIYSTPPNNKHKISINFQAEKK